MLKTVGGGTLGRGVILTCSLVCSLNHLNDAHECIFGLAICKINPEFHHPDELPSDLVVYQLR